VLICAKEYAALLRRVKLAALQNHIMFLAVPPESKLDGSALSVAIVAARFNEHITLRLLDGAIEAVKQHSVRAHEVFWVPGSFELPVLAKRLAESGRFDAVVCLGAVIRHETDHYLHIATQAAAGIQRVALDTGVPCTFGVLTCDTEAQALARSGDERNVGAEALESAIETANLLRGLGSK
jgi:6,7-dimethyl-8-ribityllumazine synthase